MHIINFTDCHKQKRYITCFSVSSRSSGATEISYSSSSSILDAVKVPYGVALGVMSMLHAKWGLAADVQSWRPKDGKKTSS